jgi:hypothetical protein
MMVWCQYRPGVYHVVPTVLGPMDDRGHRARIDGLTVEFTALGGPGAGSALDTNDRGWDEETRLMVETYLQAHPDWGHTLVLADEAIMTKSSDGPGCSVMMPSTGGVRPCGRPVEEGLEVCTMHARQLGQLKTLETQAPANPDPIPARPDQVAI